MAPGVAPLARDAAFLRGDVAGEARAHGEARAAFLAEIRDFPANPHGYTGLALLEASEGRRTADADSRPAGEMSPAASAALGDRRGRRGGVGPHGKRRRGGGECAPSLRPTGRDEVSPGHLGRLLDSLQSEERRRDVAEGPSRPQREPRRRPPTRMNGTGLIVCAVCGCPVTGSIICSALPWSAVIARTAPAPRGRRLEPREARVERLDGARSVSVELARVADHVRVGVVDDEHREAGRRRARARPRR